MLNILPYIDPLVLLEVSGEQVFQCLENGVSQFPKLEGRFPQVNMNCFYMWSKLARQKVTFSLLPF